MFEKLNHPLREDIEICVRLLRECIDIPLSSICFSHQTLGYAHSAQLVHNIEHACQLFHELLLGIYSGFKGKYFILFFSFKLMKFYNLILNTSKDNKF